MGGEDERGLHGREIGRGTCQVVECGGVQRRTASACLFGGLTMERTIARR